MALSNRDRIQRGLDLLQAGLEPFVERELRARLKGQWADAVQSGRRYELEQDREGNLLWDNYALFSVMLDEWRNVFWIKLGPSHRTLVHELREVRNRWARWSGVRSGQAVRTPSLSAPASGS